MKCIFSFLLLAGALSLLPGFATAKQASTPAAQPQAAADPQAKESSQTSPHKQHHRRSSTRRHHRSHKTSAKP